MKKRTTHPGQLAKRKLTKKDLEYNEFMFKSTRDSNPKKFGESKKK